MMALLIGLCAVLVCVIVGVLAAALWIVKVSARVERIETVLSQLGPSLASRLVEGTSTKVAIADRWYDELESEDAGWRS